RRPMKNLCDLAQTYRRLIATTVVAAGALFGAPLALACGTGGYSYAGVASSSHAFGIGATVTPLAGFNVLSGHVAGWVGVGGPRPRRRLAPARGRLSDQQLDDAARAAEQDGRLVPRGAGRARPPHALLL